MKQDLASRLTTYEQRESLRYKADALIKKVNEELLPRLRKNSKKAWLELASPVINFVANQSQAAGTFVMNIDGTSFININAHYLKEHPEYTLNQTLPHEVAHYVVFSLFKERIPVGRSKSHKFSAHGQAWQEIMNFFGLDAIRCHSLSRPSTIKKKKAFIYACNCMEHEFTSIRHARVLKGSKYTCNKCGSLLHFIKGE